MNNLKDASWIMTELPIRKIIREVDDTSEKSEEMILLPILPVPIALKFIGISNCKKYMLFRNLLEEYPLFDNQVHSYYYAVRTDKSDILDWIINRGIDKVIWIIGREMPDSYLKDIEKYEPLAKCEDEYEYIETKISEVIGVFLENNSPAEIIIHKGERIPNLSLCDYVALHQKSIYKEYFSDFEDSDTED